MLLLGGDRNNKTEVIAGFAPMTAGTGDGDEDKFDLLISTDVLAEGVNLQQARHIINYDLPWNPMRLVQRHGRIDRIGSPHREVFMRCFFPDQNLDQILALEARLQAKIKQAAASIGVPRILPGIDGVDRSITQSRDQIEALRREEAGLFEEGGATASGEEFRRRLAQAIADVGRGALQLPWTAGTGFTRPGVEPSIVFCARIGDHPKPWFRRVVLNDDLTVKHWEDEEGEQMPMLVEDTLACLDHADPGSQHTEAVLTEDMYQAAFDAWEAAKNDIYSKWTYQSDPMNLAPEVPKVMRDAAALVEAHGAGLGDAQDTLRKRLNAPYSNRVLRQVRHVLNDPAASQAEKVERLYALATELNLQAPAPVEPLPPINPGDINLICWAAVSPTPEAPNDQTSHPRDAAATADSPGVSASNAPAHPQEIAPPTSLAAGPSDGVADMLTLASTDELF